MKRLGTLALFASLVTPLSAQTVVVGVGGQLTAPLFDYVWAPVYADMTGAGGAMLGSYTVRVTWDPNLVSYSGYEWGSFAEGGAVRTDSVFAGVLRASGIRPTGMSGVFDLIRLRLYIYVDSTSMVNVQAQELSASGTFANLLQTATVNTLGNSLCPARGLWGDVDLDGVANSRDALAILSGVVGIPTGFDLTRGDVDGDGASNTRDVLILLSYSIGLDIPGQRVLLPIPGPCITTQVPTLKVLPDTADLVIGQSVKLLVRGTDATGKPVALHNVTFQVTNPLVGVVDGSGVLTVRDTGTTTVRAAIGPGVTVTGTVVGRARRRVWRVNAAVASQNPVQLGNARWPLSTPQRAFPHVREGDTIRVAPGIHDYDGNLFEYANTGFVMIGDTLPGNVRPVLRASENDFETGAYFQGGVRAELRDLVFRGFYYPVQVEGLRTLVMHNVRIEEPKTRYGYGVGVWDPVDSLLITNSQFLGDTSRQSGDAIDVSSGAKFVRIHDTQLYNWGNYGIYLWGVDSVDVRRVDGQRNGYALYSSNNGTTLTANRIYIGDSRFAQLQWGGIEIYSARSVTTQRNFIHAQGWNAIQVRGVWPIIQGSKYRSTQDSIKFRADDYNHLYLYQLDSVLIDSLWVENPADTAIWQYGYTAANYVRVRNSQFLNLFEEALDIDARQAVIDNSTFTGCAVCDWLDADAVQVANYLDSGPQVTVTNSSFYNLRRAIDQFNSNSSAGRHVITNNTLDSVQYGIDLTADSVIVSGNVLTKIRNVGIITQPSFTTGVPFRTAVITGNQVTCTVDGTVTAFGIQSDYAPQVAARNTITDCDYGIYHFNSGSYPLATVRDSLNVVFQPANLSGVYGILINSGPWTPTLYGNRVRRGQYGIYVQANTASGTVRIDSNAVSEAQFYGVYLAPSTGTTVTGVKNRINANLQDGIFNSGTGARSFTGGEFIDNARYAVNSSAVFDASSNWWGNASGSSGICTTSPTTPDCVSSANVSTATPLASAPAGLPPLGAPAPYAVTVSDATMVAVPALSVVREGGPRIRGEDSERAAHLAVSAARREAKEAVRLQALAERERRRAEDAARRQGRREIPIPR